MASSHDHENGTAFAPKWNRDGLIAAVATDRETGEALMLAWMNEAALSATLETGEAHFYSRSRQELWHKGATSGNVLTVHDIRIDCDQDAIWLSVSVQGDGAACHTGRRSCFFRNVTQQGSEIALEFCENTYPDTSAR